MASVVVCVMRVEASGGAPLVSFPSTVGLLRVFVGQARKERGHIQEGEKLKCPSDPFWEYVLKKEGSKDGRLAKLGGRDALAGMLGLVGGGFIWVELNIARYGASTPAQCFVCRLRPSAQDTAHPTPPIDAIGWERNNGFRTL